MANELVRMACKPENSEQTDGNERLDIISHLEEIPLVLEAILRHVDCTTLFKTVFVSKTWERLITNSTIWKRFQQTPVGKILCAGKENLGPKVLDRMGKRKKGSAPKSAIICLFLCKFLKEQIFPLNFKNPDRHPLKVTFSNELATMLVVNEKYLYIPRRRDIKIVNRWTERLVNVLEGPKENPWSRLKDVQLNERVIAVKAKHQSGNCSITVYELEHLNHVQSVEIDSHSSFCLGSNDLITCADSSHDVRSSTISVYRWHSSSAEFVEFKTNQLPKLPKLAYYDTLIYVDWKYLIVDLAIGRSRIIRVFDLETIEKVRERRFTENFRIRRQYSDGAIAVQSREQDCVALWDVDKDTVEPIADHPTKFVYSFAMNYHPYQIVIDYKTQPLYFLRRPLSNSSTIPIPKNSQNVMNVNNHYGWAWFTCYFDGVQLMYLTRNYSSYDILRIVDIWSLNNKITNK